MSAISLAHNPLSFPCEMKGVLQAAIYKPINSEKEEFLDGFLFVDNLERASQITKVFKRVKKENSLLSHIELSNDSSNRKVFTDHFIGFKIRQGEFPSYIKIFEVITKAILNSSKHQTEELSEIFIQEIPSHEVQISLLNETSLLRKSLSSIEISKSASRTVYNSTKAILDRFLDCEADIDTKNYEGDLLLHEAAEYGNVEEIIDCLDCGDNINATNLLGDTALHLSAEYGHVSAVKLLIERGAPIEATNQLRDTPLHGATDNRHIEVMAVLLLQGANVNAVNEEKETPLHYAARNGDLEAIALLLKHKADIEATNQFRETPLLLAIKKCDPKAIDLLLKCGATLICSKIFTHASSETA